MMEKPFHWKLVLVLFGFLSLVLHSADAQTGLTFRELKSRLSPYFPEEMIWDVQHQLPAREDYRIWGWDVGDYSGDGYPDLALCFRKASEKQRIVEVVLFVDIEGFLVAVAQFQKTFVQLPIEVGVAIKDSVCYIVNRQTQQSWSIQGYQFRNGALMLIEEIKSIEQPQTIYRYVQNFQRLEVSEQWVEKKSGALQADTSSFILPVYQRFQILPPGLMNTVHITSVDNVPEGAFYWAGPEDCSYQYSAVYYRDYLYLLIHVVDDTLVVPRNTDDATERIEFWVEPSSFREIDLHKPITQQFREEDGGEKTESGLMIFEIFPGDFLAIQPSVRVQSLQPLDSFQLEAMKDVRIAAKRTEDGYQVKIRIPFQVFGFLSSPVQEKNFTAFRAAIVVADMDNRFRPEETTKVVSSKNFDPLQPATYSVFCLIPPQMYYGEYRNLYTDVLIARLEELGF